MKQCANVFLPAPYELVLVRGVFRAFVFSTPSHLTTLPTIYVFSVFFVFLCFPCYNKIKQQGTFVSPRPRVIIGSFPQGTSPEKRRNGKDGAGLSEKIALLLEKTLATCHPAAGLFFLE